MWNLARGVLPLGHRAFTHATLTMHCPVCMTSERSQHSLYDCLIPAALIGRVKGQCDPPGNAYASVRYLKPLPKKSINLFVLVITETMFQVWKVLCFAVYGEKAPTLNVSKGRICYEIRFHHCGYHYKRLPPILPEATLDVLQIQTSHTPLRVDNSGDFRKFSRPIAYTHNHPGYLSSR